MPTTKIYHKSCLLSSTWYNLKGQKSTILKYILGLFLPKHVNESQIASKVRASQSTMPRALSQSPLIDISNSRIAFLKDFITRTGYKPQYLIIDETVIRRYGTKSIEFVGKYYSSIQQRVVNGIELLTSVLWINSRLYFPVFTTMANPFQTSTEQFIQMIDSISFGKLILLSE